MATPTLKFDEHRWHGPQLGGNEGPRVGLILQLELAEGSPGSSNVCGVGEASPLPEFGHDNVEQARRELEALDGSTLEAVSRTADAFEAVCDVTRSMKSPSARNAVETCVLDVAAQLAGVPMWRLISGGSPPERLPASAVVNLFADDFATRAAKELDQGLTTLKLKCGHHPEKELQNLAELERLAREGPGSVNVRLDPNASWRFSRARQFLERLRELDALVLDWVEDPTPNPFEWVKLSDIAAIAADEILVGREADPALLDSIRPDVVILKPMALGGFTSCFGWMALAEERDMQVSVSHFFDGPVALDAAVHFAFSLRGGQDGRVEQKAPGLGLHAGLSGWSDAPRWVQADHLQRPR